MPYPEMNENYQHVFDEIVINQEAQVAPAYVLMLDPMTFPKLIADFNRSVPKDPKHRGSSEGSSDEGNVELSEATSVELRPLYSTATTTSTGRLNSPSFEIV